VPVFSSVSVADLVRLAGLGRQMRYESGQILYQESVVPEQLQFLLDGGVTASAGGRDGHNIMPPAALAFEEILDGRPMQETLRTSDVAVCLVLGREEFRTLLSDNTELVQGLFRILADQGRPEQLLLRRRDSTPLRVPAGMLTPIEKALLLQQVPIFADVAAEEMRFVVTIANEVQISEGSKLFTESDPPAVWVVLAGRAVLEPATGGEPQTTEAGDVVGFFETLAGSPIGCRAAAAAVVRALRIDRDDMFDLCGQRPQLLRQLLSAWFRAPSTADDSRHAPMGTALSLHPSR
jgi:CRP-like cAMP-binding protein